MSAYGHTAEPLGALLQLPVYVRKYPLLTDGQAVLEGMPPVPKCQNADTNETDFVTSGQASDHDFWLYRWENAVDATHNVSAGGYGGSGGPGPQNGL